jgi:heme exporter protein D
MRSAQASFEETVMQWGSIENFLAMGGYGFFVWGSYGVTLAVIAGEIWALRHRRRRALAPILQAPRAGGRSA